MRNSWWMICYIGIYCECGMYSIFVGILGAEIVLWNIYDCFWLWFIIVRWHILQLALKRDCGCSTRAILARIPHVVSLFSLLYVSFGIECEWPD